MSLSSRALHRLHLGCEIVGTGSKNDHELYNIPRMCYILCVPVFCDELKQRVELK
jgi:hypothetical protein